MKNIAKMAIITVGLLGMAHQTVAQTVIDTLPYVISTAGNYILKNSLTWPPGLASGNAITVNATDVTIDLNGFYIVKLDSGERPQCFGIYSNNQGDITVKNGIISGFYVGIHFDYSSGLNINANHLVDGITLKDAQAFGIVLTQATNCLIRNCVIANTGFDHMGNVVSGIGIGIDLSVNSGAANALINNRIAHSLQEGIATTVGQSSGGTYLEGNLVSNSPIGFGLGQNDKYRNNTTISCGSPFHANGATDLGGNN